MTDNEIEHFLALEEKVNSASFVYGFGALLSFANAYFDFYEEFGVIASILVGCFFTYHSFLAGLKDTENAKSYALIQKLISNDADLIKRVIAFKNDTPTN